MKQYQTPKILVWLCEEDVITTSTLNAYDDIGSWNNTWSDWTGGMAQ